MQFIDLVRKRYSLRRYDSRPVERSILDRCIEAARLAPSAVNSQPWHFIVVDEVDTVQALAKAASPKGTINRFARQAPVIAAIVAEKPKLIAQLGGFAKGKPFFLFDIGIAAEHFCLQAAEEGVGTCMIGWFNESAARKVLGVPAGKKIALLITAGYPREGMETKDEDRTLQKKRKTTEDMSSYNRYTKGN